MADKQLEKYLSRHPDLTDGLLVVSISEAGEMLRANPMPAFEDMIAMTKKRYPQYTAEQWATFDKVIERGNQKGKREYWGKQFVANKARLCKLAVAGFAAALVLFFTLMPAGRALAKEIYNYIITVIDNMAAITQRVPEAPLGASAIASPAVSETKEKIETDYLSLSDFRARTGLEPFELHADWLTIESISSDYSPDFGYTLWINYIDNEGNRVRLSQEWFTGQEMVAQTEDDAFEHIVIRDQLTLYYGIDPENGNLDGIVMLEDSFLFIGADGHILINDIFDALS